MWREYTLNTIHGQCRKLSRSGGPGFMVTSPNNWLFNSLENIPCPAACPLRSLQGRTCQWRNQRKCRIRAKGFWVHGMALGPCRKLAPSWLHVWPDSGSISFISYDWNHTPPSHETGGHDVRGYMYNEFREKKQNLRKQEGKWKKRNHLKIWEVERKQWRMNCKSQ